MLEEKPISERATPAASVDPAADARTAVSAASAQATILAPPIAKGVTATPPATSPERPTPSNPTVPTSARTPTAAAGASRIPVQPEPVVPGPVTVEPILDQNAIAQPVSDQPIAAAELPPGAYRAGRNLPVAIAVGVGLAIGIVVSLVVYRPAFLLVVTAAVLVSLWELRRVLASVGARPPVVPLALGSVAMIAMTWLTGLGGLAVGLTLTVLAVLVWRISDGPVDYFRDISTGILITLYVPLLACMAVLMLRPDDGVARIVTFILTVVCSDVGGYAAGVRFGRHAMSPTVSPKKSWEGLAGSVLACMIAGMFLVSLALDGAWWQGMLYGIAIAVTATVGDLGESIIKRDLGIKDMGSLLPGHGGLMDRMDSLLPSAAVAYLLLAAFVPQVVS